MVMRLIDWLEKLLLTLRAKHINKIYVSASVRKTIFITSPQNDMSLTEAENIANTILAQVKYLKLFED